MFDRKFRASRVFCVTVICLFAAVGCPAQESTPATVVTNAPALESFRLPKPSLAETPQPRRVTDKKFFVISALVVGLTISDVERTQHCLHRGTCIEMNPMLPHSRAGMYAVNVPINVATLWLSYRMKSQGRRTWWIAPALVAAGHGMGTAFRF